MRVITINDVSYSDFSYSAAVASDWAYAEAGVAIITVCGTTFRPLLDKIKLGKITSWRHTSTSHPDSMHTATGHKAYGRLDDAGISLGPIPDRLNTSAAGFTETTVAVDLDHMSWPPSSDSKSAEGRNDAGAIRVRTEIERMEERK